MSHQTDQQPVEGDRPSGQDEVREALIQAGLQQVATKGLQFSVRDVADVANVNHGLVHRYFGSKAGLVSEVLDRFNRDAVETLDEDGRPGDTMWADLPEIAVVLARIALETDADPFDRHPVFSSWIDSVRADQANVDRGAVDDAAAAKARVVSAAAMALGWALFRQVLLFGVDADGDDERSIEVAVRRAFVDLGGGSLSLDPPRTATER